jgi:hypothetical protein
VKRTLSAVMFFGLAAAMLQGTPANAQTEAGSIFHVVQTPNENKSNSSLFAASASSANDIWAVGNSTIHFDGTKWTAFPAPLINGDLTADLQGVVDVSPTQAWAVGNVILGANLGQIIERWDGTKWSLFPNPTFPPNSQADLFAMTSTSANDIWAVGNLVQDLSNGQALSFNLFEHWNGTAWKPTLINTNAFEALTGVSADSTNDAWAVGWVAPLSAGSNEPLAIHWNGTNWVRKATPHVGEGENELNAVLALAPNDVWAVGFSTPNAPPQQSATRTLIEHFDGTSWTVVPSPNVGPHSVNQSNRLLGLTANSTNDIWAFGSYFAADGSGHQMTLLLHYDGASWTIVPSPDPTKGTFLDDLLFAGVVPSPGNVWIFGNEDEGANGGMGTLAVHTTIGE